MKTFPPAVFVKRTIGRRLIMGILPAAFACVILFSPLISVLELFEIGAGQVKWCARIGHQEVITLSFIHSVNKRPVYDTLVARGGQITITESRFDSFGAGMPESSTDAGTLSVLPDGWLQWTIKNPLPQSEVIVRVGRVSHQVMSFRGMEFPLASLSAPGSALSIRTRKKSLFYILKGGCRNG